MRFDIARTTDMRTFIAALVAGGYPCANVLPVLETPQGELFS